MSEFVGMVWENGEFGVALAGKESPACPFDLNAPKCDPEQQEWNRNLVKAHGAIEVLKFKGVDPLGFSPLPKNHKTCIRGQKGITSHGKKLIRNACYRLEQENSKDVLTFATFTLPDVTREESLLISRNWGQVQRVFIQKLTRALKHEGLPGEVVGAVEVQEKRSFRDGVLAIHLHLVFVGRKPRETWAISPIEYGEMWKAVIQKCLFHAPDSYDWRAVHNVQRVKKSVEGYLGKYASKGVKTVDALIQEFGEGTLPSHWYSCSNTLRERVMGHRVQLWGEEAFDLVRSCMEREDVFFVYFKPITVMLESGREITVGWFGRIKQECMPLFNRKWFK